MAKKIRKWSRYILISLGIIITIPVLVFFIVQLPAVQTSIVRKLTEKLSEKLQAEISVDEVNYRFFNRLALSGLLFKDNNNDTLLYTERLTLGIRKLGIKEGKLLFGRVFLENTMFNLISDTTGQMNINWYLDKLRSTSDTSSGKSFMLSIDRIDLKNASFSLINRSDTGKIPEHKMNFADMRLSPVNGIIEDFLIDNDTVSLNLYNLKFREKSGFNVSELSSGLTVSGNNIVLESTLIQTDSSILNFERLGLHADSSFRNFATAVRLDVISDKSNVSSHDLRYFVPIPDSIDEEVILSGRFSGTISELRGRDVGIEYKDYTRLLCDFDISGLPDIQEAFIYVGVSDFRSHVKDIMDLKIKGKKALSLPDVLTRLGIVSFNGSFSGFLTDFVTYGEFKTSVGNISTDISLRPDKYGRYRMQGLVSGSNINLGELTGSDILGFLSMHANIDGNASSIHSFEGNLSGRIDSVQINNYEYRNIDLKGNFTEDIWDGRVIVMDRNIRLDLLGMFNFKDTLPEFDFSLDIAEADLYQLNFDKKDTSAALSLGMTSNFKGNSFDNIDGEIRLLSSNITRYGKTLDLHDFTLRTFKDHNVPVLSLNTDFLDAEIRGNYSFKSLKNTVMTSVSSAMPSLANAKPENAGGTQNDFTFTISFKNTGRINDFFGTGLTLAEASYIKGAVLPDSLISVEGLADFIVFRNIRVNNISVTANTLKSRIVSDLKTSSLDLPGSTILRNFSLAINTEPDLINLKADWDNKEPVLNKGLILARGALSRDSILGNKVLKIGIDSSEVHANNSLWKINQSGIILDSGTVSINNIRIESTGRFYNADGTLSRNRTDTLYLAFKGIDISPINHIGKKQTEANAETDTSKLKMNIKGRLSGNLALTNVFESPLLESNITVEDFSILGNQYGNILVNSGFDYNRKVIDITASNDLGGVRMFNLDGFYDPDSKKLSLDILASKLPVGALNPLLRSFASDISGSATGKLNLSGTTDNLVLKGAVKAEKINMRINYLNTLYTIDDSIKFDKLGFRFNNMRFSDDEGHSATLSGTVYHTNFNNFTTDLTINMGDNFKVLNTTFKDNSSFYGKAYASGVVAINIEPDLMSFDISATTGRNTSFSIPLTDEQSVSEYSFITIIDATKDEKVQTNTQKAREPEKQVGFNINIDLNVTSDALVQLIFDEKIGDIITGSGTGMLNINLNPKGEFKITGDYEIESGEYLFTLSNIFQKNFKVENGGLISFDGDLENAEINLKAIYKKFNTSLAPILQDEERAERVSVEPQILLTGKLFNPTVDFEINLPDSDEETKTYLSNAISTDEELSKQFMSLLLMNRFYSGQSSAATSNENGTNVLASTTMEMLSNQLSNWISQFNENVNLGINYQPGDNRSYNPDEVQLAFETQLLNDRVKINGNFDYSSTTGTETEKITGDFEAELKIKKVKFKVFNRFNDVSMGKGQYTQGIGMFFGQEFNKFSDLFKKRSGKEAKKEEEVTLKENK